MPTLKPLIALIGAGLLASACTTVYRTVRGSAVSTSATSTTRPFTSEVSTGPRTASPMPLLTSTTSPLRMRLTMAAWRPSSPVTAT